MSKVILWNIWVNFREMQHNLLMVKLQMQLLFECNCIRKKQAIFMYFCLLTRACNLSTNKTVSQCTNVLFSLFIPKSNWCVYTFTLYICVCGCIWGAHVVVRKLAHMFICFSPISPKKKYPILFFKIIPAFFLLKKKKINKFWKL